MRLGFYQPANGSEPDDRPGGSRRRPERLEPPYRDAVQNHRALARRDRPLFRVVALPVLADEHHRIGQRHGGAVVDFLAARRMKGQPVAGVHDGVHPGDAAGQHSVMVDRRIVGVDDLGPVVPQPPGDPEYVIHAKALFFVERNDRNSGGLRLDGQLAGVENRINRRKMAGISMGDRQVQGHRFQPAHAQGFEQLHDSKGMRPEGGQDVIIVSLEFDLQGLKRVSESPRWRFPQRSRLAW